MPDELRPSIKADEVEDKIRPQKKAEVTLKTWYGDWEYPLARGIKSFINLFKKKEK